MLKNRKGLYKTSLLFLKLFLKNITIRGSDQDLDF